MFWASNIVLVKLLLNQFDANLLALYKALLSSILLFVIIKNKICFCKKEIVLLFLSGLFSVYLNYFFSYRGMKDVSLVEVSLMNMLLLVISQKEITIQNFILFVFIIIGLNGTFNFYLTISMICYLVGMKMNAKVKGDDLQKTMLSLFFGSVLFLPSFEIIQMSLFQWALFLGISVLGYGYIMYVYYHYQGCNRYLNLHPILTYIFAITFLEESIYIRQIIVFLFSFGLLFYQNMIDK